MASALPILPLASPTTLPGPLHPLTSLPALSEGLLAFIGLLLVVLAGLILKIVFLKSIRGDGPGEDTEKTNCEHCGAYVPTAEPTCEHCGEALSGES